MKKTEIKTRKLEGEIYTFILNEPEFKGEKGVLNIEIDPYIHVITPANCFGCYDFILFNKNRNGEIYAVSQYRNHPNWILKQLTKTYKILAKKYGIN